MKKYELRNILPLTASLELQGIELWTRGNLGRHGPEGDLRHDRHADDRLRASLRVTHLVYALRGLKGKKRMTAPKRVGNKSFENVVRTDERYGHDGLWLGPRGRDYGALLEHPKPYQIANLCPGPPPSTAGMTAWVLWRCQSWLSLSPCCGRGSR